MKTFEEVKEILSGVQYKKDWVLTLHRSMASMYMQWTFWAPDYTDPGQPDQCLPTRKYNVSPHMTESELVQTAFHAAQQAEEHECREAFSYRRYHLFNPHINVRSLMSVCAELEVRG